MSAPDAKAKTPSPLNAALDAMAAGVRRLHAREATGALAALRRLDPDTPFAPAFHALLADSAPDHLFAGGSDLATMTRRFARIAQIMAMKPDGLGGFDGRSLGTVLRAIDFKERSLAMLLNAQGPTLDDLVRRTARRIALSDEPLPYRELGRLLLDDRREARETLRLRIARDYQRAARDSSNKPAQKSN
jgi:hypothetical protein